MNRFAAAAAGQSLARALEPLWVAALGVHLMVGARLLLPGFIRLLGRGGAVETVEWATYMATLFIFPPAVWVIGWLAPRILGPVAASHVKRALVLFLVAGFAVYAVLFATALLVTAAVVVAALAALFLRPAVLNEPGQGNTSMIAVACGTAAWMAGGALVYWENALEWLAASPVTVGVVALSVAAVLFLLRSWLNAEQESRGIQAIDFIPVALLVAFSFRTTPIVEYYHWGFFIGPIDHIRQGGTLLWDTPSQYGFLSILIPSLLPGTAWQSFWLAQSVAYAVVACLLYLSIRRLSSGWPAALAAFIVTFPTLFFRPRTESLILAAQMTPAAGPYRFIWCFLMLAFLVSAWKRNSRGDGQVRFAATGTLIWLVALLWSAETAIYVSAMWFPALLVHTLQSASANGLTRTRTAVAVLKSVAWPVGAAVIAGIAVMAWYQVTNGAGPDLLLHFDYVLLYSEGGYGSLPIDLTGTIWYLIVSFLIVTTILTLHATRNPHDSRLIIWAAAWGGIWAVASYFTGRSHPVNLVALVPFLIYTIAICMRTRPFGDSLKARYAIAATVLPLMAMPAAVTAGHRSFGNAISERQLPPSSIEDQIPLMDPELQTLLASAGAGPGDSFVLVADGRLMLERWANPDGTNETVRRSWLPRPFEMLGSLPADRQDLYLERNLQRVPASGWLVRAREPRGVGTERFLRYADSSLVEQSRAESAHWIVEKIGYADSPVR